MGANHNYFNSEWTPGLSAAPSFDDWFGDPAASPCGSATPSRLRPFAQEAAGRVYVAGWFEMLMGGSARLLPLFDGSGSRATSAGAASVETTMQFPASDRRDLARFDASEPAVHTTGANDAPLLGTRIGVLPAGRYLPPGVRDARRHRARTALVAGVARPRRTHARGDAVALAFDER